MSYYIELRETVTERVAGRDGERTFERPCQTEHFEHGGTYELGGTSNADFNITYNYSDQYARHLDAEKGIRWLYGKTGAETVGALEEAIAALGTDQNEDYWRSTPGNAGYALTFLLRAAKLNPHGVWSGD